MSGLEGLGIVANVIAVVDLSLKVISWCSKYAQDVKNAKDSRAQLLLATHKLHYQSEKLKCLLDDDRKRAKLQASSKLLHAMGNGQFKLKQLEALLSNRSRGSGMKWPLQKQEVESAIHNVEQSTEAIVLVLEVDMAGILVDLDDRAEAEQQRSTLDKLPYVSDAAFDSHAEEHNPTCLPETRVDLLKEIHNWIDDPKAKTIFWLNGMAGTGKSTISRTVAQSLSKAQKNEKRLGASFFFKRGETDRGSMFKFIPTLARQLAASYPVLANHIQRAIQSDPTLPGKALRIQFKQFITEPLSQSSRDFSAEATSIIVIDALDECESDNDIRLIINLFSQTQVIQKPRLRIFLTSRPELPIRLGFKAVQGTYQDFILHEVATPVIEHDISLFLRHELARIRVDWNSTVSESRNLPLDWPRDDHIQLLTKKAIPLFIFAATVCRFITDHKGRNPDRQLQQVLKLQTGNTISQMDSTYWPVLSQLFPEGHSSTEIESIKYDFKRIVGPIILLFSPLSSSTLSRLLDISQDMIDDILDNLHSVLSVPSFPEAPIRMLHLSFRDYLISPEYSRTNPVWLDGKQTARALVRDCFRVMDGLTSDICHLTHPAKPRSTLKPVFIDACLPPEVQYACLYWVHHQESAGVEQEDISAIFNFLKKHLLHWIEALTLLGKVWQIVGLIRKLRVTLAVEQMSGVLELTKFLDDAIMFFHPHASEVNATPLQLYSSVLTFAPTNSIVRKTFVAQTPPWITLLSGRTLDWDSRLQVLDAGGHEIKVAFSSDSQFLSSVSRQGRVIVWSIDTGECVEVLDIGSHSHVAVISPDCKAIAVHPPEVGSGCVQVIDLAAGGCSSSFGERTRSVSALRFSKDSACILLASMDGRVTVWDRFTGSCVQELFIESPKGWWSSIEFSPSSSFILLVDKDRKTHVWCLEMGKEIIRTPAHYDRAHKRGFFAFSHDNNLLALISGEHEVQVWSLHKAQCIWNLREDKFVIKGIRFLPNSTRIATVFDDHSLRIWDISIGQCFPTLFNWGESIDRAQFSPKTDHVVWVPNKPGSSWKPDSNIRIWDLQTGDSVLISKTTLYQVKALLFSPHGAVLAWVSYDGSIQLLDWLKLVKEPLAVSNRAIAHKIISNLPRVARITTNGNIRTLSTETGAMVQEFCIPVTSLLHPWDLKFSPDSTLVAAGLTEKSLKIWDLVSGCAVSQLKTDGTGFVFSPNSEMMATATRDQCEIRVWSREGEEFILKYALRGSQGQCWPRAFSPDSKWLVSTDNSRRMWVWNLDTQKCEWTIFPKIDSFRWLRQIVFSLDSTLLAANIDDEIIIWDMAARKRVGTVSTGACYSLGLSPVGTFLACSGYKEIRIWNWETGVCLARAQTPRLLFKGIEFLPYNYGIYTELGTLILTGEILANLEPGSRPREVAFAPLFGVEGQWVQYRGHDLVKLPGGRLDRSLAVLDDFVALDGELGETILLKFSERELKRCLGD